MTVTELAPLSGPGLTASVAAQLRAAADFLDNTPGIKVSPFAQVVVHFFADDPAKVDELAALLGKEARWDSHHYAVSEPFGREVTYTATHVCKGHCKPSPTGTGAAA